MSLSNFSEKRGKDDESDYPCQGCETPTNTPRLEAPNNSGNRKEINTNFEDETYSQLRDEKGNAAIKSFSMEKNCSTPKNSLQSLENAELLINESDGLDAKGDDCRSVDALKETPEIQIKCRKQENKQYCEDAKQGYTNFPTAPDVCVLQRFTSVRDEEDNVVPKVSKQRVKKRGKDLLRPLNMKVKMKKIPIKELGTLKQDEETSFGGIFRLHVCNKQEGKRLEKLKKKKKCKVHKVPLGNVADDDVPEEWFGKKVWNTLCHYPQLGSHAREEYYRRIIRWRKGFASDVNKDECILCDIQQVTPKPLFKNINTINYSHDFYERFSRQSRNTASSSTPVAEEELTLKYRSPPPVPPTSSLGSTPLSPVPRRYSNIVSPCKITSSPQEMLREKSLTNYISSKDTANSEYTEDFYVPRSKFIHQRCVPNIPPVRWAPERNPSRTDFLYRRNAFKACLTKKETTSGNRVNIPPIQKFAVKDLGVTYVLPDSNQNLAERHVSIPKCYTYSPRSPRKPNKTDSVPAWIPPIHRGPTNRASLS